MFIALFATKVGQAVRLAPGSDFSGKALHIMEGLVLAFESSMPSFHPIDLCIGILIALAIRLAVYIKGKAPAKEFMEWAKSLWSDDPITKEEDIEYLCSKRDLREYLLSGKQALRIK